MTKALWRVRSGTTGRELMITTHSSSPGEATVLMLPNSVLGLEMSEIMQLETVRNQLSVSVCHPHGFTLCACVRVIQTTMQPWQRRVFFDDVTVETRMLTVSVTTPSWTVNVTSKPIYGLVPPLINETHVHGKWEEDQRRLDLLVTGAFPQPNAHGIVGQSYRDSTVHQGKLDQYLADIESTDSSPLPPMKTRAQAEGAIEGIYTDYKLSHAFATDFKFSKYNARMTGKPAAGTRIASTSEWDGGGVKAQRKREL